MLHLLSSGVRKQARRAGVRYLFLFMAANGEQLSQITALIEAGIIRPVLDRVFAFPDTNAGLAYVDKGRAKGKVVIKVR